MIFEGNQDKLQEMGDKIQSAMEAIDTIVRFPQHLQDVKFSDEKVKSAFEENSRTLRFELVYIDSPEIKSARKKRLDDYEKELEEELAKLKKAKEGL